MTNARLEHFIANFTTYSSLAKVETHGDVSYRSTTYPLVSIRYGNPVGPSLIISGGVHGLERIGAQLTLSLLNSFHERMQWDKVLHEMLTKIQIIFIPLVNPVGYFETTRGNAAGVDLMRNAPIEAEDPVPFLLGGHRLSNKLHWYRGTSVQPETQFLIDVTKSVLEKSKCVISLDIHSGFGFRDQLWFPFAGSRRKFTHLNEMMLLFDLFESTHRHHVYKIEPQSKNYLTHGDVWDYCFYNFKQPGSVYLPLTMEMGSWIWVKKNPLQLFSKTGLFNPIKAHRINRTLRRHRPFFDFLLHALYSNESWAFTNQSNSFLMNSKAIQKYYDF
jgi:hypothetical protein